jgi:hypothetical protein
LNHPYPQEKPLSLINSTLQPLKRANPNRFLLTNLKNLHTINNINYSLNINTTHLYTACLNLSLPTSTTIFHQTHNRISSFQLSLQILLTSTAAILISTPKTANFETKLSLSNRRSQPWLIR